MDISEQDLINKAAVFQFGEEANLLKNEVYNKLHACLSHWKKYQKLASLSSLREQAAGLPFFSVQENLPDGIQLPRLKKSGILYSDYSRLGYLKQSKCLPHLFKAPDSLEDYYSHVHHLGNLKDTVAVVTQSTSPAVLERLSCETVFCAIDDPCFEGLEVLGLWDKPDSENFQKKVVRLLGCTSITLQELESKTQPAKPVPIFKPVKGAPPVPDTDSIDKLSAQLEDIADSLAGMVEDLAEFAYCESPGWTADPELASIYAAKFAGCEEQISSLFKDLPACFIRTLRFERDALRQAHEASRRLSLVGTQLIFEIQYVINSVQGYLSWCFNLQHDLKILRDGKA